MNIVEKHPQRAEIIEAIIAGESIRSIAKRVTPPVNFMSISRFRLNLIGKTASRIRGKSPQANSLKEIAAAAGLTAPAGQGADKVKETIRRELQNSVQRRKSRRERWISEAERRPIIDQESGKIVGNMMDHKALAAHDRNEGSDIEFTAKLHGLLVSDQAPAGENTLVLSLPRVTVVLQQGATVPAARVIDVKAEE